MHGRCLLFLIAGVLVVLGEWRSLSAQEQPAPPATVIEQTSPTANDVNLSPIDHNVDFEARLRQLEEYYQRQQAEQAKKKDVTLQRPSVNWTGQVQTDAVWFGQSAANRDAVGNAQDGVGFRRARLGAFGEIYQSIQYRIEMDFALPGRPSFLDTWISINDLPAVGMVKVGHFFEPFGLERLTSNRYMTFLERGLPDVFTPKRHTGIMAQNTYADRYGTWAVGGFRSLDNNYGDDFSDQSGWSGTGRVTYLPWYEDHEDGACLWHVGGAYSYRAIGSGTTRFASRPEATVNTAVSTAVIPFFVDTGDLATTHYQLFGAETALVYNNLSLQAEYMWVPLHRSNGSQPDLFFQGAYVYGSWYLTGEHRRYSRATGIFDRTIPFTNAFKGPVDSGNPKGIGAWELAVRWSSLDLSSQDVAGGRLNDVTFGLNWYLNPYTRITWNYIHSLLDSPVNGDSFADIYGMRFGFEF